MTDNMFDNFVRDKLTDHQSPVPQGLWEKIERKKDKDPKGGFWLSRTALWAGLLFILMSMGVGYYFMKNGEASTNGNDQQLSETAAAKNNGSSATNNTAGDKGGNGITAGGNNNNSGNSITPNINNNKQKQGSTTGEQVMKEEDKSGSDLIATSSKATKKKYKDQNSITTLADNKTVPSSGKNKKNNSRQNLISLKGKIKKEKKENKVVTDEVVSTLLQNNGETTAAIPQQALGFTKGKLAVNLRSLSSGSKDKFDLSGLKISGIDCPTAGRLRRNDWYLEVYASPDMAMKTVSAKTNPIYVQKKDSTETTQVGYTAGFRFSRSIGDNLLVKAGLQYSQINERFDLRTENERRITTVITIRTITTPSGADTTVRDTTTLEQIGYSVRRTYNRYRSIDIPLLISYEFGNEKLKFAVNAGAVLNLRSWYIGETLNDSLAVVSLNSKSSPMYKQNIGIGIYAGFSIIKPMSKTFDLFLEPYFRYNLSNMATGSAYTQKFNAAGLSFGIRYKLNRQHH